MAGADREVVEVVDARIGQYGKLRQRVLERDAGIADHLVVGQRDADRVVVADLGAHGPADLEREAAAVLDAAAVLVVAAVVEAAQELADQPAVRSVDLDAVQPGGLDVPGRARVVRDDLVDLALAEREGALATGHPDVRRAARGAPDVQPTGAHGCRAAGDELSEESRRVRIESLAHRCETLDLPLVVRRDRRGENPCR